MPRKRKKYFSRRKSFYKKRWFWRYFLILIFFLGLSWLFFKSPYFKIKDIKIEGIEKETSEEIKKNIKLANIFLIDSKNLLKNTKERFPYIDRIKIKRDFPNSLLLQVIKREPAALFCFDREMFFCFLISKEGVIFSQEKREDLFKIFMNKKKPPLLGERVIEESLMRNILLLENKLKEIDLRLYEVEILLNELRVKTEKGFYLYFSKNNLENQIEIFPLVFEETISEQEKEKLEYIDLRGIRKNKKGKIYFKSR